MTPEVKTIYHSMLTRRTQENILDVPKYALETVDKYNKIINPDDDTELQCVKNILKAMIKETQVGLLRRALKKIGL